MDNKFLYKLLFLWFKALFYSDDYQKFCNGNKTTKDTLREKYPNIDKTFDLWKKVHFDTSGIKNTKQIGMLDLYNFDYWFREHRRKLGLVLFDEYKVVRAGTEIILNYGTIYYTVSQDASINEIKEAYQQAFQRGMQKTADEIDRLNRGGDKKGGLKLINGIDFCFHRTSLDKGTVINSTARRIDAYLFTKMSGNFNKLDDGYKPVKEMLAAIKNDPETWYKDKEDLEKELIRLGIKVNGSATTIAKIKDEKLRRVIMTFIKCAREGKNIISNATNFTFPKYR